MLDWLRDNLPEGYADAILWVLLALLLFFVLLIVVRTLRRFRGGTFVLGGRNRRTRLAVMDATPVDSRRRLVLVRRDDVEHLILIGGPTDVVVERDIRIVPRVMRAQEPDSPEPAPRPAQHRTREEATPQQPPRAPERRIAEPPRPVTPAPQQTPLAAAPVSQTRLPPAAMPMSAPPSPPAPKPVSAGQSPAVSAPPPAPKAAPALSAKAHDDGLLDDLEITLDEPQPPKAAKLSADDEMTRLLGELSQRK